MNLCDLASITLFIRAALVTRQFSLAVLIIHTIQSAHTWPLRGRGWNLPLLSGPQWLFLECFACFGDAGQPGKVFAAWAFSKLLLLVLSLNVLAKVRVIVLGKCHWADRAALASLLFVQFRPFFSPAVCLKLIQHVFAASPLLISRRSATRWDCRECNHYT